MKIAVIGAGYTGLSAAYYLSVSGHQVEVFESDSTPGGLAGGFRQPGWEWPLDKHYHHLFVSDHYLQNLAAAVGVPINFIRPLTSTYYAGEIYQLDSPLSLLKFSQLSVWDRLRTGIGLALLKYNPVWQPWEKITAKKYIETVMGKRSWEVIWEPLFRGKFGDQADKISAAWFWARIYTRSQDLGYPEGGFDRLSDQIITASQNQGVKFHFSSPVTRIKHRSEGLVELLVTGHTHRFDAVICTSPSAVFTRLVPDLPEQYREFLTRPKAVGAVNLVLSLTQKFLPGGVYWLNINDRTMPFLAVVEHTNFIDSKHYAGETLLYIGNYLPPDHPYFSQNETKLLDIFSPHLQKINPGFSRSWVNRAWVWKSPFAQPLIPVNYSRQIPPLATPIPRVYLANIQQVYPWDRGTNYAIELGQKAADLVIRDLNKTTL